MPESCPTYGDLLELLRAVDAANAAVCAHVRQQRDVWTRDAQAELDRLRTVYVEAEARLRERLVKAA